MINVHVTIYYGSEEYGSNENVHILEKNFQFDNIPQINGIRIKIENDAISYLNFNINYYDPKTNTYYISMKSNENVKRYYHGSALELMQPVLDRYKKFGWKVIKK